MEQNKRNLLVARIIANRLSFKVGRNTYFLRSHSPENIYLAEELFEETYQEAIQDGLMDETTLLDFLNENNYWNPTLQDELDKTEKQIDDLKVALFQSRFGSDDMQVKRFNLKHFRERLNELYNKRHRFDHLTSFGLAHAVKYRFLIGCSIYRSNGTPFWKNPLRSYEKKAEGEVFTRAMQINSTNKLDQEEYREIARTEPWRSHWACREDSGYGLFKSSAVDLSEEQRALILWSKFYDNIFAHQDRPSEAVINDDDCLDGFCIFQKRKESDPTDEKYRINNPKIANSDEVFIMTKSETTRDKIQEAKEIDALNSPQARSMKAQKMKLLAEKGSVNEIDMPDTQLKLKMEITRQMAKYS